MYCRNCGVQLSNTADFCVKCGAAVGNGMNYCPNCGRRANPNADVCIGCGIALHRYPNYRSEYNGYQNYRNAYSTPQKSKIIAGLLGIFLGGLGIHNFYLGYKGKAIAQLLISVLSFGFLAIISSIWGLIEGILILVGTIDCDANGVPLKD